VIVVAGDHGESLGEHQESTHGYFVYDAVQRVPLLFWGPSLFAGGRRISDQVGTPALHRTLLEIAGIDSIDTPLEAAASLVPGLLGGKTPAQDQVLESDTATEQFGAARIRALRTGKWKWIDLPDPELYDLAADPNESQQRRGAKTPTWRRI
jgi:arylsulfatase A-like enzyme